MGTTQVTAGDRWSMWLEEQLDARGWKPADLVRASGKKPNGRAVIDASRVSQWLDGQIPKPELLRILAQTLGADEMTVLRAAGFQVPPTPQQPAPEVDVPATLGRDPRLSDEARRILLAAYAAATANPRGDMPVTNGDKMPPPARPRSPSARRIRSALQREEAKTFGQRRIGGPGGADGRA